MTESSAADAFGVRELRPGDTGLAFLAMSELRPDLDDRARFEDTVDRVLRPQGYRLVGAFVAEEDDAVAVAGFRFGNSLAWGRFLYVDDLVTRRDHRRRGHAGALLRWVGEDARRCGCDQLHLDSATHRHDAHRFYLAARMDITGFHFVRKVDS